MQEILAENLEPLFDNSDLSGKCTYRGKLYEVWEVSDKDFVTMCSMSDEDFEKLCPEGMWRSAVGSNMGGCPDVQYEIKGNNVAALST